MRRTFVPAHLMILVVCFSLLAAAEVQPAKANERAAVLRARLTRQIEQITAEFDGVMGVAVKDLTSGDTVFVNADLVFPQASSIKIPILVELFRQAQAGRLRLDERVEVKRAQTAPGSGVLQHFGDGTSAISLRDLATLMIVLSDNTATNILIERVGLPNVNDTLHKLGLEQTRLQRKMMETEAQRAGRENLSTPREMATLLELLHQGKALDAQHSAAVLEILKYPKNTPLRRGLPEGIPLANKPGGIPGVRCDSGIVLLAGRPYVIAVMTTYNKDVRPPPMPSAKSHAGRSSTLSGWPAPTPTAPACPEMGLLRAARFAEESLNEKNRRGSLHATPGPVPVGSPDGNYPGKAGPHRASARTAAIDTTLAPA